MSISMYSLLLLPFIFVSIDAIFLYSMSSLFKKQIEGIQGSTLQLNIFAAAVTYVFLLLGLYYFILRVNAPPGDAFVLGIVVYAVYEFTSMSLFTKWSFVNACIDTLWGGILFYLTTFLVYQLK